MRCRMPTLANPPWVCRATKEPSGADNEREKPPATEAQSETAATQNVDNADTSADFETPDRAPTLGDVMTLGDLMAPAHMRPCKYGDEPGACPHESCKFWHGWLSPTGTAQIEVGGINVTVRTDDADRDGTQVCSSSACISGRCRSSPLRPGTVANRHGGFAAG